MGLHSINQEMYLHVKNIFQDSICDLLLFLSKNVFQNLCCQTRGAAYPQVFTLVPILV